jgi:hypothetical protein
MLTKRLANFHIFLIWLGNIPLIRLRQLLNHQSLHILCGANVQDSDPFERSSNRSQLHIPLLFLRDQKEERLN